MRTIYHLVIKGGNCAAHHYYSSLTALHLAHADILPSKYTLDRATFPIIRDGWEIRKGAAYSANEVRANINNLKKAIIMKNELYRIKLKRTVTTERGEKYPSNDGYRMEQDEWDVVSHEIILSKVTPKEEFVERYEKADRRVKQLEWELRQELGIMGVSEESPLNIPYPPDKISIGEYHRRSLSLGRSVNISKESYENLLLECKEESSLHGKESVLYFIFHSGIRGKYIIPVSSPGIERHNKFDRYGFDSYCDMEKTPQFSEETIRIISSELFPEETGWDYRYMPENKKEKEGEENSEDTLLGSLLKEAFKK